ncbi:MAG: hypothetical protein JSS04_02905 [Proteobacteria bacterium]|nr:hypothetical protein [Pseudomonadota bacterium]
MKIDGKGHMVSACPDGLMTACPRLVPALAEKVAFLSTAQAYGEPHSPVTCKETHMSYVFLCGGLVYKLKKPVRLAYLDFSSLEKRRQACIAEWKLNRRLAPDIYLGVVPLLRRHGGLAIGGDGEILDWLVVMRRLDPSGSLESRLAGGPLTFGQMRIVVATLDRFYRRSSTVRISPSLLLAHWREIGAENHATLSDPRSRLPASTVRYLAYIHGRFLDRHRTLLAERAIAGRIVDGHGDLRPEHIWVGPPPRVIDCLEFNAGLRAVDPGDDLSFLSLECRRLGHPEFGAYIHRHVLAAFELPGPLFRFYRSCRATIRARLAIAHLFEPTLATPGKWLHLARSYLRLATEDAMVLENG